MDSAPSAFQKYIFVCENERATGSCCMPQGAQIRLALKERVQTAGLAKKIRVSRAGCLDVCADGPNVLLMPDNRWFKKVALGDVDTLLQEARKTLI